MLIICDVYSPHSLKFRISGRVTGTPSPELIWLKNGKEVHVGEDSRYELQYSTDGKIDLKITDCNFADDDEYSLLVENIAGVDSCNFEIFVDCKGKAF